MEDSTWARQVSALLYDLEREYRRTAVYHIKGTGKLNPLTGETETEDTPVQVELLTVQEDAVFVLRDLLQNQLRDVGFEIGTRVFIIRKEKIQPPKDIDCIELGGVFYSFKRIVTIDPNLAYLITGTRVQ